MEAIFIVSRRRRGPGRVRHRSPPVGRRLPTDHRRRPPPLTGRPNDMWQVFYVQAHQIAEDRVNGRRTASDSPVRPMRPRPVRRTAVRRPPSQRRDRRRRASPAGSTSASRARSCSAPTTASAPRLSRGSAPERSTPPITARGRSGISQPDRPRHVRPGGQRSGRARVAGRPRDWPAARPIPILDAGPDPDERWPGEVRRLGDSTGEIEGLERRQLRMRMVTIEPGGVFGPIHDHIGRPGTVYVLQGTITDHRNGVVDGLRAGTGLARGSEHDPLAREQGNDSGGGDLGRYRHARRESRPYGRMIKRSVR